MAPSPRLRHGPALAEAVVFLGLLAVPLAASPRFLDQFTAVKWAALGALAAGWLIVERFLCGSRGLPGFGLRTGLGWMVLGSLVIAGSLRKGPGWAMEPLLSRSIFVTLALAAFWYFRRTHLRLAVPRAALAVAAVLVTVPGLLQFAGRQALPWLTSGDQGSSTFGNLNMAAQFVGLALVVLLSGRMGVRRAPIGLGLDILAGGGLVYVYLAETRSVTLALATAGVVLLLAGRLAMAPLLRTVVVAAMLALLAAWAVPAASGPVSLKPWGSKMISARMRLAVWSDTLGVIRDHPMGVGSGNFEHTFIPYALGGRSKPGEAMVFRSPHNEYLRFVAEEGIAVALLLLALLVALVRKLHRSPAIAGWRSEPGALLASCGAFFLVEAFFQFPFEMAFPSLLAAVLLGLALACIEGSVDPEAAIPPRRARARLRWAGDAACVVLALALGLGVVRTARAEWLTARAGDDVEALERACALDPRRLEACVEAAWLRGRAGDHAALREGVRKVLAFSPHYPPALKLLGEDLLSQGETTAGCRTLRAYDAMFGGRSSVHERVRASCP